MKTGRISRGLVLAGALIGTLAGCSDSSFSTNEVDTDTYLFYTPYDDGGTDLYGLKAVNPAYPSTPIKIFGTAGDYLAPFYPAFFLAGNVDSGSKTISDLHYRYVMYTDGNTLVRIDAEKDGGLGMVQVSNETGIVGSTTGPVPGICYSDALGGNIFSWAITDYANPLDSVFIYRKDPDGTTDCSTAPANDTFNVVQLGDDDATPPNAVTVGSASEPVAPVYNTDGSINSILTWSETGNTLRRYSVDMALQATLDTGLAAGVRPLVLGIDGSGNILLAIRGGSAGAGTHIRQYSPATQTLSASLYTDTGNTIRQYFASDGTYAYFHDARKVYRVPFDGSANASVVIDESTNFTTGVIRAGWNVCIFGCSFTNVHDMRLSGNNLVYIYDDSTGTTPQVVVRSVPKSGGTAKTILTAPADAELLAWRTAYGRVYLSRNDLAKAISVGDQGQTPTVYDYSWWTGFTFDSTARLFSDFNLDPKQRGRDLTPKSIFRVQYSQTTGGLPASLISYDANTTSELINFGVPAPTFGFYNLGGPPDTLGLTTSDRTLMAYNGMGGGNDILYLHARNKSSMTVVERDSPDFNLLVGVNNGGGCSMGNGRFDPLLPAMILLASAYLLRKRIRAWVRR